MAVQVHLLFLMDPVLQILPKAQVLQLDPILQIQQQYNFVGLHEEIKSFLNRHEIIDVKRYTKSRWKKMIGEKIDSENRNFIIQWSMSYKKIDTLSLECEDYGIKDYLSKLSLADSRLKFRERSNCMKTCRMSFPSQPDNFKANFECLAKSCTEIDSLSHWYRCKVYSKIIKSQNL